MLHTQQSSPGAEGLGLGAVPGRGLHRTVTGLSREGRRSLCKSANSSTLGRESHAVLWSLSEWPGPAGVALQPRGHPQHAALHRCPCQNAVPTGQALDWQVHPSCTLPSGRRRAPRRSEGCAHPRAPPASCTGRWSDGSGCSSCTMSCRRWTRNPASPWPSRPALLSWSAYLPEPWSPRQTKAARCLLLTSHTACAMRTKDPNPHKFMRQGNVGYRLAVSTQPDCMSSWRHLHGDAMSRVAACANQLANGAM